MTRLYAEVMDKMPAAGDIESATIFLLVALPFAGAWHPLWGMVLTLASTALIFGTASVSASLFEWLEAIDPLIGPAILRESPGYYALITRAPICILAASILGVALWFIRRRNRHRV